MYMCKCEYVFVNMYIYMYLVCIQLYSYVFTYIICMLYAYSIKSYNSEFLSWEEIHKDLSDVITHSITLNTDLLGLCMTLLLYSLCSL